MRSKLVLLVAQRGVPDADGRLILPAKLVDGVATFARYWPGEVVTLLERNETPDNHLDNRAWAADELPGRFELVDFRALSATWRDDFFNDAIVLAFADHRLHGLARLCHSHSVPYVVNTELSLKTQLQILFNDKQGWSERARSTAWTLANHASTLVTISRAAGLQTNGTPTFDAYRAISPDPLLYFDTRITASMMAAPADVEARLTRNSRSKKLRLLFSGRLVKIKGVGHLVEVARMLRAGGLDFELAIAGDGPLRKPIEAHAAAAGLQDFVKCLGALDFKTELVPMLREQIDLFVCPHLQGDPSCTYLETMSAGVPIVGYANEAFEGVQRASGAGWHVPLGEPAKLAAQILHIARHPAELREHSLAALDFATKRTFEAEFVRRIDHLLAIRHRASKTQPARALPAKEAEPPRHPSQFGGLSGG